MVVILSSKGELSVELVKQWLTRFEVQFIHFVDYLEITYVNYSNDSYEFELRNSHVVHTYKCTDRNVFLYRKGRILVNLKNVRPKNCIEEQIYNYQNVENNIAIDLFLNSFEGRQIGSYRNEKLLSKMKQLNIAKECGLNIPEFLVTSSKSILEEFVLNYKSFVTKPLTKHYLFEDKERVILSGFVEALDLDSLNLLNDSFPISFFQRYIHKKYEIRTFYLMGECYSMIILSQDGELENYDFRNEDENNPFRIVPCELPLAIVSKLNKLAEVIGVNTMSIDFVIDDKDKMYFLEINPTGQFGWLSKECNYYLERIIAEKILLWS